MEQLQHTAMALNTRGHQLEGIIGYLKELIEEEKKSGIIFEG